jgi:carboxyl-terminal processing protease
MPLRNLTVLFLASVVSLACYLRADRNRYAWTLGQAMNVVTSNYLEEVGYRELYEGAMRGMVEALDQYSDYIGPDYYQQFEEGLNQEFGGIGIMVEINPETNRLTVMTPLVDTPAFRAGLKAGDTILAIDGQDTEGMSLQRAVKLMRGRPGDPVRLSILHAGAEESEQVVIKRAVIPLESVLGDRRRPDGAWLFPLEDDPRILYIRLVNFGERSVEELTEAIRKHDFRALILDLRDNAGGLLSSAVGTCDLFIDDRIVVTTRGREGQTFQAYTARPTMLLPPEVPMVVLVNGYSASASEIVAACLQDYGRATVIGERTWGKGTVQNVIPLEGGRAALKLTTASYWRPSGNNIHRLSDATEDDDWGVRPDDGFHVALTAEEADRVRRDRRRRDGFRPEKDQQRNGDESEDHSDAFFDPPLRRAIEHLQSRLDAPSA